MTTNSRILPILVMSGDIAGGGGFGRYALLHSPAKAQLLNYRPKLSRLFMSPMAALPLYLRAIKADRFSDEFVKLIVGNDIARRVALTKL